MSKHGKGISWARSDGRKAIAGLGQTSRPFLPQVARVRLAPEVGDLPPYPKRYDTRGNPVSLPKVSILEKEVEA